MKIERKWPAMKKKHKLPERSDGANAFVPEPSAEEGPVPDDLAEYLGETFVASATGGDDGGEVLQEDLIAEELGGPFIETDARAEFGESLARGAPEEPGEPEAFPTAVRGGRPSAIRRRP
jgi:hypothetical protein